MFKAIIDVFKHLITVIEKTVVFRIIIIILSNPGFGTHVVILIHEEKSSFLVSLSLAPASLNSFFLEPLSLLFPDNR